MFWKESRRARRKWGKNLSKMNQNNLLHTNCKVNKQMMMMKPQFLTKKKDMNKNHSHLNHHCISHHSHNQHISNNLDHNNLMNIHHISILQNQICRCISLSSHILQHLHFQFHIHILHYNIEWHFVFVFVLFLFCFGFQIKRKRKR